VAAAYGVLNKEAGVANRATFVISPEGKITYIEEGKGAIDPSGAAEACSRSAQKARP
jgi:peroxiredoxin